MNEETEVPGRRGMGVSKSSLDMDESAYLLECKPTMTHSTSTQFGDSYKCLKANLKQSTHITAQA